MEISDNLRKKLDQKVESFIKEMTPSNGSEFTYNELMPVYKRKLREFSSEVYGQIDEDFIEENVSELNLSPVVRESTDAADEIITSILDIEIAKIIYENRFKEPDFDESDDLLLNDKGRESIRLATEYLLTPDYENGQYANVISSLSKYIYRNSPQNNLSKNNGCLLLFIIFTGAISTLFIPFI